MFVCSLVRDRKTFSPSGIILEETQLAESQILAMRDGCLSQVQFARAYLLELVKSVPTNDWFSIPAGAKSHIAWHIGHLTVAQYGLMLFRQRGRAEIDTELMPGPFRKKFAKGTQPADITSDKISCNELLAAMQKVHEESIRVAAELDASTLWEPADMPYAGYARKLGALLFCPLHEMIHAGQVGTLRRALGLEPIR
jgi:hypothetical protein